MVERRIGRPQHVIEYWESGMDIVAWIFWRSRRMVLLRGREILFRCSCSGELIHNVILEIPWLAGLISGRIILPSSVGEVSGRGI